MQTLTVSQCREAIVFQETNLGIGVEQVRDLLRNTSVTFAQITYVARVQTAAKPKQAAPLIYKVTAADIILCNNIRAESAVYQRLGILRNIPKDTPQGKAFFRHTSTHCIISHTVYEHKYYLHAIYNSANSIYIAGNEEVDKEYVAQYLPPIAATAHLKESTKKNASVRTIALSSLVSIKARRQFLSV